MCFCIKNFALFAFEAPLPQSPSASLNNLYSKQLGIILTYRKPEMRYITVRNI